jgi:hypothetical protein
VLGFDMPLGIDSANSLAMEFQMDVAPNRSRPPINAHDIVAIGASLEFRHRF